MRKRIAVGWAGKASATRSWCALFVLWLLARSRPNSVLEAWLIPLVRMVMRRLPFAYALLNVPDEELATLVRRSALTRLLIAQVRLRGISMWELLKEGDHQMLSSIVGRELVARNDEAFERSRLLYDTVVLGSVEAGPHRLAAALRTIQRVADTIATFHASALLKQCLLLSSAPIDPYKPPSLDSEALLSAVAILQHHPELDQQVTDAAAQGVSPNLLVAVTAALQRRSVSRTALFGEFLAAWKPTLADAMRFARDADSRFSAADPLVGEKARFQLLRRSVHDLSAFLMQSVIPIALGPALTLLLIAIAPASEHLQIREAVGYGVAVGVIALIVTVNVLSTELAAGRLPGLVARHSSSPPQLRVAYSLFFSLLLVLISDDAVAGSFFWSEEVAAALLVILFLVLVVWMWALLKRLSPSEAVAAFARTRFRAYRRAGKEFGLLRRSIVLAREVLASQPHIRMTVTASQTERRKAVVAKQRGFVLPHLARIRRLADEERWRDGALLLQAHSSLGTIVNWGEEIGSVVPSPGEVVSAHDERKAIRCLEIRSSSDLDEISEICSVLVGILSDIGAAGDQRGAARVADALVALLNEHLAAASEFSTRAGRKRSPQSDSETAAVISPSVYATTHSLLGALFANPPTIARQALLATVERLLNAVPDSEVCLPFSTAVWTLKKDVEPESVVEIVRLIGRRAVEAEDRQASLVCRDVLEGVIRDGHNRSAMRAAGELCITAVWRNYFWIHELWNWFVVLPVDSDELKFERVMASLRVGAAGTLSGNLSAALVAATFLKSAANVQLLEPVVRKSGALEQFLSDQGGHYLGEDAEQSLVDYLKLVRVVAASVA